MTNVNLNAGGFLGALAGAGIAFGIVFAVNDGDFPPLGARALILGLVAGALAGNALWAVIAGKPKPKSDDDYDDRPRRRSPRDDEDEDDRPRRKRRDADDDRA